MLKGTRIVCKAINEDRLAAALKSRNTNIYQLDLDMGYTKGRIRHYIRDMKALPISVLTFMEKVYGIKYEEISPDPEPVPEPEKVESQIVIPEEWEKKIYRAVMNATYKAILKAAKELKEEGVQ